MTPHLLRLITAIAVACRIVLFAAPGSAQSVEGAAGARPRYRPSRAQIPPHIDGLLDDAIWKTAPVDERFLSFSSRPLGLPAKQPTTVQAAYDSAYIYVAFTCRYATRGDRDDDVASDEVNAYNYSEYVSVKIDARHDHSNARVFGVSRIGQRIDVDETDNGVTLNFEWSGIWDVAVERSADGWTAEFAIPWGTVGLPSHDEEFAIGINFDRGVVRENEYAFWSLPPPTALESPPSTYGHLVEMSDVHPRQYLFVQPYVAASARNDGSTRLSPLRDFTRSDGKGAIYSGLYARYRPPGPMQVDLTLNPDFSQVTPDQALSNLDRFELIRPEVRPFFSEDRARFEFGDTATPHLSFDDSRAKLFYSRRVGLRPQADGMGLEEVPILYGAKGVLRHEGTEVAAMNVGLSPVESGARKADDVTVVRLNHLFGRGTRVGNIFMSRASEGNGYMATGIDGAASFLDEHFLVSGFLAGTATRGQGAGAAGNVALRWQSEDFRASLSYLDVADRFDPQLGLFLATGVRDTAASASYARVVNGDMVRKVELTGRLERMRHRDDTLLFDRGNIYATATLLNYAMLSMGVAPSTEGVAKPLALADGRIPIAPGKYNVVTTQFYLTTAPHRTVNLVLGYSEGNLFDGYQRSPWAQLTLNSGPLLGSGLYRLFSVRAGNGTTVNGHQVSGRVLLAYGPLTRSVLAVEANTFNAHAAAQFVTSHTFGTLSTLSLVLAQNAPTVEDWFQVPERTAILSFALGLSPF